MNQPEIPDHANSGSKKCWSCDNMIPYALGWCDACWNLIPYEVQLAYCRVHEDPEIKLWSGAIALAVANCVRQVRTPKPQRLAIRPRTQIEIELEDLI